MFVKLFNWYSKACNVENKEKQRIRTWFNRCRNDVEVYGKRIKMEFSYYKLINNVESFLEIWGINEVLCVTDDGVLFF